MDGLVSLASVAASMSDGQSLEALRRSQHPPESFGGLSNGQQGAGSTGLRSDTDPWAGDHTSEPPRSSPGRQGHNAAASTLADMMGVDAGRDYPASMRMSAPAVMRSTPSAGNYVPRYEHSTAHPHRAQPAAQLLRQGQPQVAAFPHRPSFKGQPVRQAAPHGQLSARASLSQRGLVLHITEHTVHRIDTVLSTPSVDLRRADMNDSLRLSTPSVDLRRADMSESQRFDGAGASDHMEMVVSNLRLFSMSVALFDAGGVRVTALPGGQELLLRAELIYENGLPVETLGAQEPPLVGKTELGLANGQANFRLRITSLSSHRDRQRFRVRVTAVDSNSHRLEAGLFVVTKPMKCVTKLATTRNSVNGYGWGGQPDGIDITQAHTAHTHTSTTDGGFSRPRGLSSDSVPHSSGASGDAGLQQRSPLIIRGETAQDGSMPAPFFNQTTAVDTYQTTPPAMLAYGAPRAKRGSAVLDEDQQREVGEATGMLQLESDRERENAKRVCAEPIVDPFEEKSPRVRSDTLFPGATSFRDGQTAASAAPAAAPPESWGQGENRQAQAYFSRPAFQPPEFPKAPDFPSFQPPDFPKAAADLTSSIAQNTWLRDMREVHAQIEAEIASLKRTVAAAVSTAQATANEAVAKVNNTFAKKP